MFHNSELSVLQARVEKKAAALRVCFKRTNILGTPLNFASNLSFWEELRMKEKKWLLFSVPNIFIYSGKANYKYTLEGHFRRPATGNVYENCFSRALKKKRINHMLWKKLWKNRRYVVLIRGKEMAALSSVLLGHPNILMALDCAERFGFILQICFWAVFVCKISIVENCFKFS